MDITLIRHTNVDVPKGLCYGFSDVPLASTFKNEKLKITDKIKGNKFDIVYASPLSRCKLLAESIFPNHEIIYDDRLKELNFGIWEGLHWDDISQTKEANLFFKDYINTKCPSGESYNDLNWRIYDFIEESHKKHTDKKVAVVCHGGPIRAFLCITEKISPQEAFEKKIDYGEVIKLKYKK